MPKRLLSRPGGVPRGVHRVPGDKSVSHRALLLAGAAGGETVIHNLLDGSDCRATARSLAALGVDIRFEDMACVRVRGDGEFASPEHVLDLGNSGTGLRLLAGLLAGREITATLTGDASLRARPMRRVADPLNAMGAEVETSADGNAPVTVRGRRALRGIDYVLPVASAQVKSAILLAGLAATEPVLVREPMTTRDHTERMLKVFGATIQTEPGAIRLDPGADLRSPGRIDVPGDLSSAAFLFAAAALTPGARVTVEGIGINPTRTGVLRLLERMGASVIVARVRELSGEPVGDVTVTGAGLRGIDIGPEDVALAIDEIPLLLAMSAMAEGRTVLRGAGELKVKESDRLAAMAEGLRRLDIDVQALPDGLEVRGGRPAGGMVDSHGDHRIAMSLAILGQVAAEPVHVHNCEFIETSFPGFAACMHAAGLDITESDHD